MTNEKEDTQGTQNPKEELKNQKEIFSTQRELTKFPETKQERRKLFFNDFPLFLKLWWKKDTEGTTTTQRWVKFLGSTLLYATIILSILLIDESWKYCQGNFLEHEFDDMQYTVMKQWDQEWIPQAQAQGKFDNPIKELNINVECGRNPKRRVQETIQWIKDRI